MFYYGNFQIHANLEKICIINPYVPIPQLNIYQLIANLVSFISPATIPLILEAVLRYHITSFINISIYVSKIRSLFFERLTAVHSVQFSRLVVSDSLRPQELQHARPPCPSPTPRVY